MDMNEMKSGLICRPGHTLHSAVEIRDTARGQFSRMMYGLSVASV